jgi:hypothetical protein
MDAKNYKRWALDGLRERAEARGIPVAGQNDEPRLLLRRCDDLSISYQEDWWRSALKRSGFGGSLWFEINGSNDDIGPVIVLLVNLGDFFIPIRSAEDEEGIDLFLERLVQLTDWCVKEKLEDFRELVRTAGTALSKMELAAKHLREFPFRESASQNAEAR